MTSPLPTYTELPALKDFEPFAVDPVLRWMRRNDVPAVAVAIASIGAVVLAGVIAAAHAHGLWVGTYGRSTVSDISTLFARPKAGTIGTMRVPLLRDYPTIILAFSIATAAPFIYCLFQALSKLHSTLAVNGCLDISTEHSVATLEADIDALNTKIASYTRPQKLIRTYVVAYLAVALMLVRLSHGGFFYLTNSSERVTDQLYRGWWARPFSIGFFVASAIGAIGVYLVYVEAVVGLHYVAFLRRHRTVYRFRANKYNVDGHYGWAVLGRAYTYMLAGVATATLSAFAMYYFLEPQLPTALIFGVLGTFLFIVCYVSAASSVILRHQVMDARVDACRALSLELDSLRNANSVEGLLLRQILNAELTYFREIPNFPIRTIWVFTAATVTFVGLSASIAQVVSVLTN